MKGKQLNTPYNEKYVSLKDNESEHKNTENFK
jgi:hypothetical protein